MEGVEGSLRLAAYKVDTGQIFCHVTVTFNLFPDHLFKSLPAGRASRLEQSIFCLFSILLL